MLTELSIRNFAIIDDLSITFSEGLTVLTGETGAGKSIIIDAIQLLAGGRGSVQYVRHGTNKAEIDGLFTIDSKKHPIYETASYYGIEILDGMVVLQRTMTSSGKSICRVNGKLTTLAILREFGKKLIDIHSQHETQSLMDHEHHIELLDLYNDSAIEKTKSEYTALYEKYLTLKKRYQKLSDNEQELSHRLDLLEFQMNELNQADLQPEEDIQLEEERSHLIHFEKIYTAIEQAYIALYGEEKAIEWLNTAQFTLQENRDYDPFLAEKADELTNYFYNIEEISFQLRDYKDQLHYDQGRLNEIEARLNEINRLKRKYGSTVNEMIDYQLKIEEEIDQIKNKDSLLSSIKSEMDEALKDALVEAKELHLLRKSAATSLEKDIQQELKDLYLENATFSVSIEKELDDINPTLHKNGIDRVQFLISTNIGEPLKPLNKVASGGELSRIMLVIKKLFSRHQGVTSVIFDEVDTGVSGRVAQAMAEKIYQISIQSQVLCITHLPQVAAMSDTHKLIQKMENDKRTTTTVHELTVKEKVEELSRMMTGIKITDTAKEHGKKLLDLANQFKNRY